MSQYSYPSPYYAPQQSQYYTHELIDQQQQQQQQQQWESMQYVKAEESLMYQSPEVPMYYEPNTPPYTPTYAPMNQQFYSPVDSYFPRTETLETQWQNSPISSPTGSTYSTQSLPAIRIDASENYERRTSDINIVYSNNPHSNTVLQPAIQLSTPPKKKKSSPSTRIAIIDESDLERPEELSKPFILKLSYLLSNPEQFSTMIQWDPSGKSFILAPSDDFVNNVLSDIFSHRSLPAFYRQLKTYNFTHLSTKALSSTFQYSPDSTTPIKELSAWTSPFFCRDQPELMVKLAPRLSKARLQQRRSKLEQHYSIESRGSRCYAGLKMGRSLSR